MQMNMKYGLCLRAFVYKDYFFALAASKLPLKGVLPSSCRLIWKVEDWGVHPMYPLGALGQFHFSLGLCVPLYKRTWLSGVILLGNF